MKEFEIVEELRRKLIARILYREDKPEDIVNIIREEFKGLQDKYEELCGRNPSISEYIEGKGREVEAYAVEQNKKKKDLQLEDINYITAVINRNADEIKDKEEEKLQDDKNRKFVENILRNNSAVSKDFLQVFEDSLNNVRVMANRNLGYRQFASKRVEDINEQIKYYIRNMKSRNEIKICEAFQNSDKELVNDLLEIYDEYMKEKEKTKNTQREKFTKTIDAGISLQEQKEKTEQILKDSEDNTEEGKNNKEVQVLPTDIII